MKRNLVTQKNNVASLKYRNKSKFIDALTSKATCFTKPFKLFGLSGFFVYGAKVSSKNLNSKKYLLIDIN